MINLLVGSPGSGKSYEAVVYHILPALAQGRKVITNLPLNLEYIAAVNPDYIPLLSIVTKTKAEQEKLDFEKASFLYSKLGIPAKTRYFIDAPFAHIEDYGDDWRHSGGDTPELQKLKGVAPLYVIDECHIPLPFRGTETEVKHWYSMHRHEGADVLLITQSYGTIDKSIRDLVQLVYRVRKATAFGSSSSYIRKVQDGIRGEIVNSNVRIYDKTYFKFYKSHTLGGGAEALANDVRPFWRHPVVLGSVFCFVLSASMPFIFDLKDPTKPKIQQPIKPAVVSPPSSPVPAPASVPAPVQVTPPVPYARPADIQQPEVKQPNTEHLHDPYSANGLHLVGHIKGKAKDGTSKDLWIIAISQNGQHLKNIYAQDLIKLGYSFEGVTDCAAWVTYQSEKRFLNCDSPKVSIASAARATVSASPVSFKR